MILTCPECATSYFVDDSRVPAAGRAVKCSHCGARWTAAPDGPAEPAQATAAPVPRAETPPADDILVEGPPPAAAEVRAAPRRSLEPPPKPSNGGQVMVLVATAAVIVGLLAGLLIFRDQVVRLWPASRPAFARVGLPADPLGLVIEKLRVDPAFQGGRPVLAVTGQIRNVRDKPAIAPSLKVSLLDRSGKPVAEKVAQPIDGRVPAGQVRHFAIAIVDPPASGRDLEVTFQGAPRSAPTVPAPARAAEAVIQGPAPVDAAPLPAGSPEALPPHD